MFLGAQERDTEYFTRPGSVVAAAHVDNKPENLLIERSGGVERAVVIDFGTVKLLSRGVTPYANTTTPKERRAFTPAYATSEQFMGLHTGPWTDVAQFGLILTEMVCGREGYADPVEGANAAQEQQHYMFQAAVEEKRPTPGRWGVAVGPWEQVLARAGAMDMYARQKNAAVLLDELRETAEEAEAAWQAWRRSLTAAPFRTPTPRTAPHVSQPPRPAPPPVPPPRLVAPTQPGPPARLVPPTQPAPPPPRPAPVVVKPRAAFPDGRPLPVGVRPTDDPRYYDCDDHVGGTLRMAYIRKGTFVRGSGEFDSEKPVQRVTLTQPFLVGVYPVTVVEYARFVAKGEEGAKHVALKAWFEQGPTHPVVYVSWHDAKAYCKATSFRLLTEAEWEYVARGAIDDPLNAKYPKGRRFPWGDEEPDDDRLWWYGGIRKPGGTCEVELRMKDVSPFGVHHLAGNVWEWVEDVYRSYPNQPEVEDPKALPLSPPAPLPDGKARSTELRVLRGGGWRNTNPVSVRTARRSRHGPTGQNDNVGFRVARGVM